MSENEAAGNALVEKLNAFDEELVRFSLKYEVSLKEIMSFLAYGYLVKTMDLADFSDGEIKKAAQDVLSTEDVN